MIVQNEETSVGLKEKIAFGGLNFGNSLISDSLATFALYYFTDVLIIPAAALSIILLVVRLFDGAIDPFIGYYIDRRTTRFGKYRGYLYYWTPVFCILYVGLFLPLPFAPRARVIWCFVIYMLYSASYSMAQVARHPLMVAMTANAQERQLLNTIKTTAGILATIVIQYLMLKLVFHLGKGSEQLGFFYTAAVFSVAAMLLVLLGTMAIQERNIAQNNEMGLLQSIKIVIKRKDVCFVFLMIFANYIGTYIKSQSAVYYMKYFINRPDWQELTAQFLLVGIGSSLLMQPVIVYAARRISIVKLIVAGSIGGAFSMLLIGFANTSLPVLMAGNVLFGITTAFPANLILTYTANISDSFSKEKNVSFNAIINSTIGLASRLSSSIAGAVIALVLHLSAYRPNVEQSGSALLGIQVVFVLITCLSYVAIAVCALASQKALAKE